MVFTDFCGGGWRQGGLDMVAAGDGELGHLHRVVLAVLDERDEDVGDVREAALRDLQGVHLGLVALQTVLRGEE
jgi:hypothetical protein